MKISVITICYNAEKEISDTILSVLSQTFVDLEYIIVDGASQDGTLLKAKEIINEYPSRNVKIISEPDKGIYDAMNKGLRFASGEWVCMMNAGDQFVHKEVLSEIFSLNIPNHVSFLFSDFFKATSFGRYFRVRTCCEEHNRTLVHQSVIYKRILHNRFGYYIVTPKIIISDYLFFLQIPVEEAMKVDIVIAKYEGGGISENGDWCRQQAICANVVFRHTCFWSIYYNYIKWKLKRLLPVRIREYIRLLQSEI